MKTDSARCIAIHTEATVDGRHYTGRALVGHNDYWDICRVLCNDPEIPYVGVGSHVMYLGRRRLGPCVGRDGNPTQRGIGKAQYFLERLVEDTLWLREHRALVLEAHAEALRHARLHFRHHREHDAAIIERRWLRAAFHAGLTSQNEYQRALKWLRDHTSDAEQRRDWIVVRTQINLQDRLDEILKCSLIDQFLERECGL